jgi:hypothetical protein
MKKELGIKEAVEILKSTKDIEFRPTNYSKKDSVGITPEKGKSGNPQALIIRRKNSKFAVYVKPVSSGLVLKYPVDKLWKSLRIVSGKDFEKSLDALVSAKNKDELRGLLEKSAKEEKKRNYGKFVNGRLQTPKKV